MTELPAETDVKKPRRFRKTKIALLILLILVVVKAGCYYSFDKPFTGLNAMAVVEPDAYSRDVDYKTVYDESQAKAYLPANENGGRMLLAALGPDCLDSRELGRRIPWEEFPTNEESKEFFENTWTPLCKIYELDPNAKPTMFGRLSLEDYLIKNGVKGDETSPNASKPAPEFPDLLVQEKAYWEEGQYVYGVLDADDLFDAEDRLANAPWTAEEFPVAARWFEENADYFDLIAQAVRQPKFGCWHLVVEDENYCFASRFETVYSRKFASMLKLRANYRIGEGDATGALDDFETTTLLIDSIFRDENVLLLHGLRGIADGNTALEIPMARSGVARPTVDECRRAVELLSKYTQEGWLEPFVERCVERERFFAMNAIPFMLNERRHGKFSCLTPFLGFPIDDETVIRETCQLWEDALDRDEEDYDSFRMALTLIVSTADGDSFRFVRDCFSGNKAHAKRYAGHFLPGISPFRIAGRRFESGARLKQIAAAILAYEADHGTLPPAFSVDANGQPLLSWRVLILPYLGDEAKALYDEFALDEPWDSKRNRPLLEKIPDVYRRFDDSELGKTRVAVLLGEESFFDETGNGKVRDEVTLAEGGDPDMLALLVMAQTPVPWTAPDSNLDQSALRAAYEASRRPNAEESDGPLKFLARPEDGGNHFVTASGSVFTISFDVSECLETSLYGKTSWD